MDKNWLRKNKILIIFSGIIVLFLAIGCILYSEFGHRFINSMYENKTAGIFSNIIEGQSLQPISSYYQRTDNLFVNLFIYPMLGLLVFVIVTLFVGFEKIYIFCLKIFDLFAKHERLFLLLACVVSFSLLACISIFILQDFPNSGDEYAYIYQAKTYLAGRFWNEPHPLQQFFSLFRVIETNGKMIGQYTPGWPLVLTLALFFKFPLCLVNPILGTASLLLIFFLSKKLYNGRVACISVIAILLSSFFLFNSASYFAHTLTSVLIILFAYFSVCFIDGGRAYFVLLAGAFFGFAFITRPYSSFLCSIPIFFYLYFKQAKRIQTWVYFALGGIFFFLLLLIYNYKISGNLFISPTAEIERFSGWGLSLTGIRNTLLRLMDFVAWTPPFTLLIFSIYIVDVFKSSKKDLIGPIFFFLVAGFLFFWGTGGNQYGPRYYYEGFPFLILFVSSKLFKEVALIGKNRFTKILFLLFASSLISQIPASFNHCREERQAIWERREPYRLVEKGKINNAIIFLKTGSGRLKHMERRDLTRNELDFSNSVLYALDLGEENQKLMKYYPQKEYYQYFFDQNSGVGHLERIKIGEHF
jgi:hypothetical protein